MTAFQQPKVRTATRSPLYNQVRDILVERLREGEWKPGDRLPTETELAQETGVSLGTLRRAVELLVEEGALIRHQGSGTYAATLKNTAEGNRFQPFESLDGSTRFDYRKLISVTREPVPAEAAAGLGIHEGQEIIHVIRHMMKHTPEGDKIVASDELFLLPNVFAGLTAERYREKVRPEDSIYKFYARELGVVITSQHCAVRYECVTGTLAKALQVPDPMPVLRFARISMAYGHQPVEYRIYRLNAENSQICFDLR